MSFFLLVSLKNSHCADLQISINGEVYDVGVVVRVSNHYIVGIVLGILVALVAGAVLAFVVMKHLRKKKKGEPPTTFTL